MNFEVPRCFRWVPFPLAPERAGRHSQIAQIFADVFRVSTPLLVLRNLRLVTQSAQSFASREGRSCSRRGAERVSRAAARLCERPRSLPTRVRAPAGPENQGPPTKGRSCAPPGAGRCFWPDRWRRSRGSLADRLAIGGPAGPQGPAGRASFSAKGSRTLDCYWGLIV